MLLAYSISDFPREKVIEERYPPSQVSLLSGVLLIRDDYATHHSGPGCDCYSPPDVCTEQMKGSVSRPSATGQLNAPKGLHKLLLAPWL